MACLKNLEQLAARGACIGSNACVDFACSKVCTDYYPTVQACCGLSATKEKEKCLLGVLNGLESSWSSKDLTLPSITSSADLPCISVVSKPRELCRADTKLLGDASVAKGELSMLLWWIVQSLSIRCSI